MVGHNAQCSMWQKAKTAQTAVTSAARENETHSYKQMPTRLNQQKQCCKEVWARIPLYDFIIKRMRPVVTVAKGGATSY